MNFYEALHLHPSATTEEIEDAYRKAARKVHPDLNQHDSLSAEARMKLLNRIRDTLTDPKRRAAYDAELAEGRDTARIETAIHETLRDSHDKAILRKRLKMTVLAGLVVGTVFGLGVWAVLHWQSRQPALPSPPLPQTPIVLPAPATSASKPKPLPSTPAPEKGKSPQVVQFGSSTQEVMDLMGKPDLVEEAPSLDLRILHYGKLRLVFRNGKLVPGSGVQNADSVATPQ